MVFERSGSLLLPGQCAGVISMRKSVTGFPGSIPLHAEKVVCLSGGHENLKKLHRRIAVGGEPSERAEQQAEKAWTTRKTVVYSW